MNALSSFPIALAALAALVACATTAEPEASPGGDVEELARRLVLAAQERTDLRPVRVWVADVQPSEVPDEAATTPDPLAERLEHELVLALAGRLNVVDSGLPGEKPEEATLSERAAARGATHLLLSDYVRQRDVLTTTVRLVDAESRLIVAAVRGEVRLGAGGLNGVERAVPRARASEPEPVDAAAATVAARSPATPAPEPPGATPAAAEVPPPAAESSAPATDPHAATSAAPTAAPAAAPASTLAPVAPAPSETPTRRWPTEDFETWYQRRQAEKAAGGGATKPPVPGGPGGPAGGGGLSPRGGQTAETEQFPWREYSWLARLLKVPEASPAPR